MFGFNIRDTFLDLYDGTEINLSLKSPLFDKELDLIPGSYSLPVTVPLTDRNRILLDFPDRRDNYNRHKIIDEVGLYIAGVEYTSGRLYVVGASNRTAKVSLLINGLEKLKDKKLSEVNLGSYKYADQEAMITHANDTAANPLNYTYAFFPVYSETFVKYKPVTWEVLNYYENPAYFKPLYINLYDKNASTFVAGSEYRAASLFPRLDFLLQKSAEEIGYVIENNWQTTDELKQLYLVSTTNLYKATAEAITDLLYDWQWETQYSVNSFLPQNIKISTLFKEISKTFFLAIVYNPFRNSIEITPLREIVDKAETHNWTNQISNEYEIETKTDSTPSVYGYIDAIEDNLFLDGAFKEIDPDTYEERTELDLDGADANYYATYEDAYLIFQNEFDKAGQFFRRINEGEGETEQLSQLVPLLMEQNQNDNNPIDFDLPRLEQEENSDIGLRMVFYRGILDGMPVANNTNYYRSPVSGWVDLAVDYSLLWNGPKGIYEQWGKGWINFLANTKTYKTNIDLSLADLLNFRWTDKVRIQNINYFVRSMNVRCTANGLKPTAVTLNSVSS